MFRASLPAEFNLHSVAWVKMSLRLAQSGYTLVLFLSDYSFSGPGCNTQSCNYTILRIKRKVFLFNNDQCLEISKVHCLESRRES